MELYEVWCDNMYCIVLTCVRVYMYCSGGGADAEGGSGGRATGGGEYER